tara:strand:- start:60 stop:575 length:516 start_codon:yes stop_codon:yes gene_type:complete
MDTTHQGHAQTTVSLILVKTMTYSRRASEKTFTTSTSPIPGTQPSVRINSKKNTKVVKQGKYFDPVDDMYITSIEREVRDLLLKETYVLNQVNELKDRKERLANEMYEQGLKRVISRQAGKGYLLSQKTIYTDYSPDVEALKKQLEEKKQLEKDLGIATKEVSIHVRRCDP